MHKNKKNINYYFNIEEFTLTYEELLNLLTKLSNFQNCHRRIGPPCKHLLYISDNGYT